MPLQSISRLNEMNTAKITLILGGQRSGKSGYAEQLVEAEGCGLYLATAQAFDDEMKDRINTHKIRHCQCN